MNFPGLGDEWGAAPPPNNPLESAIKELGSHLLQVSELAKNRQRSKRSGEFSLRKTHGSIRSAVPA